MRKYVINLLLIVVAVLIAVSILFMAVTSGWIPGIGTTSTNITVILDSIEELSALTTTRYNFASIVTSEREMPALLELLYGQRQVLVAVGHVTAGIDLAQVGGDDVTMDDGTLTLRLPPPQLFDCFLNEAESYIAESSTGVFARPANDLNDAARRFTVQQFRDSALEDGILEEVRQQAQVALGEFLTALNLTGVRTLQFTFEEDAEVALPDTCQ